MQNFRRMQLALGWLCGRTYIMYEDMLEAGSGSGSGDDHPPPDLALPITMLTLGVAVVAGLGLVTYYFSRRPNHLRQDPSAGSVALLDAQQHQQPSLDAPPETFFAFAVPQFAPPLLAPRPPAAPPPTSDTAMQVCSSSHASASEAMMEARSQSQSWRRCLCSRMTAQASRAHSRSTCPR